MSISGFDHDAPDDTLGFAGALQSRRLLSLLYSGVLPDIGTTLKDAVSQSVFRTPVVGGWPATAASATASIGFGTSWDAGYHFNISSGDPTNTFGSTALTASNQVVYGRTGPFTSGSDKAMSIGNLLPQIRETIAPTADVTNPSTTAATQIGDLVVSIFYGSGPTLQSGFTELVAPFGTTYNMAIAYKVATSAGANAYEAYTKSASPGCTALVVLKKGTYNLAKINTVTDTAGAGANLNPSAVTTFDDTLVLVTAGVRLSVSDTCAIAAPNGYTELTELAGAAANDLCVAMKGIPGVAAGTEDPNTWNFTPNTASVNGSAGVTLAFGGSAAAGLAASSTPFDVTSGDVVIAWLAKVSEGSAPLSGYIVDKLNATAGYAVEVIGSGGVGLVKFSVRSTALNTVTCDMHRGQWHVGIATYVGSTGVMTVGTKALGGSVSTATATDASHSGLTNSEVFAVGAMRGDVDIRGLLIGASTTGTRVGTLNTTGNMATALEALRQAVLVAVPSDSTSLNLLLLGVG